MLFFLRIKNIVLIESCEIQFDRGLNVLTGETGAGKSVLLSSLSTLLGERSDASLIRHGESCGSIEASFDIRSKIEIYNLLDSLGIEHNPDEELLLKRELHTNSKSRAFINNQVVQISALKKLAPYLIQSCGQMSTIELFSLDKQRQLLDTFGNLQQHKKDFQNAFQRQKELQKEIESIILSEKDRLREIEILRHGIEDIHQANLQDGEEDAIFQEYSILNHAEELNEKLTQIVNALCSDQGNLVTGLARQRAMLSKIAEIDHRLKDITQSFESAYLEIEESARVLERHLELLDFSPDRLHKVNARLALIDTLKRKYGPTIAEVEKWKLQSLQKLKKLEEQDLKLEDLKSQLETAQKETDMLAQRLTRQRQVAAKKLQTLLAKEIRSLNMPSALFQIDILVQPRGSEGDDLVEMMMAPNKGERLIRIREAASGGELSRIMLALQVVVSGKQDISTLLFDEIDANIGGTTAAIVGQKLHNLSKCSQVICITHFPQVALHADAHFQISKKEINNRTISNIQRLNSKEKEEEIQRMLGGFHSTPLIAALKST